MSDKILNNCLLLLLLLTAILCAGCSRKQPPEKVLAQVGDKPITLNKFILSYETGPPLVGRQQHPPKAHLHAMIYEKLLSQEAERLGLGEAPAVRRAAKDLEDELLIAQVFEDEVQSQVALSEQEIEEAIKKSCVKVKVKYIYARSDSAIRALRQEILDTGDFDAVQIKTLSKYGLQPPEGETGFFGWGDVPLEIEDEVYRMEFNSVSQPIATDHGYHLLKIVDIRQTPFPLGAEYLATRQKIEKVLSARRSKELSAQFVKSVMDPLHVRVKPNAFNYVVDVVDKFYGEHSDEASLMHEMPTPPEIPSGADIGLWESRKHETLVTFGDQRWTVDDFFRRFVPAKYGVRPDKRQRLQPALKRAIGLMVRNEVLLAMGRRRNVQNRPAVQHEITAWHEKWVYEELKRTIADTIRILPSDIEKYFALHRQQYAVDGVIPPREELTSRISNDIRNAKLRAILFQRVNELKQAITVQVNEAMLDSLPDWRQSGPPGMQFSLFKLGLPYFRSPAPTVDPAWKALGNKLSEAVQSDR